MPPLLSTLQLCVALTYKNRSAHPRCSLHSHQLLAERLCNGVHARARAACEDDAFALFGHYCFTCRLNTAGEPIGGKHR
jgi:hypothetical protein